ncbi:DNA repair protein XRCC2 isoform X2 [Corythoichthys intestinalis]|uniref:DNA repair protein XRCC2 isoform X2 n=1 Tax=Corythoichthys intestinalis TaxID=161448 RepID=UPI0025A5C4FC|nr:DNA repair protein XRCC2 isoform X2 [Corythoichthys intestinalis]
MTETGAQLFARLDGRCGVGDIEPRLFPPDGEHAPGGRPADITCLRQVRSWSFTARRERVSGLDGEGLTIALVTNEHARAGKTELLYHFLCRAALPAEAGGLRLRTVLVDTDSSLDMLRLVAVLDAKLVAAGAPGSPSSRDAGVRDCLSRLLVAHCRSSRELLFTFHALEARLASEPGPALLFLDSASAFYWLDRGEGGASAAKREENLSRCSRLLARLLGDYGISVLATCHANRRRRGPSSFSDLCRPWQQLVTHRVLCSRREADPAGGRRSHVFSARCTSSGSKVYRSCSFRVGDGGLEFL